MGMCFILIFKMTAPEVLMLDVQDIEHSMPEELPTSLVYSPERMENMKAKFRGIVGQLTLEMILIPEAALEDLEM